MGPGGAPKEVEELARLLEARNEHPESLREIDAEIWRRFGDTAAVFVLDMCGFSRLSVRYGITHFLAMIHRLRGIVLPLIASNGGRVVKVDADNVFAVFPEVNAALAAALAVHRELGRANVFLPDDWDLHAAIGIGYGQVLLVGREDMFGEEVNVASKLGEDVAERGEILLSAAAHEALVAGAEVAVAMREKAVVIAGLALRVFRVES
jgi:adenylate cyclase